MPHSNSFLYDVDAMINLLGEIIRQQVKEETWEWIIEKGRKIREEEQAAAFYSSFATAPRKTGKTLVALKMEEKETLSLLRPGFVLRDWPVERLTRVWLVLQQPPLDKDRYVKTIDDLFKGAEMNELVTLYSSLPLLAYPEAWRLRCAEGIRSNIGPVLEAIMCDNPYPAESLTEEEWNQMVLKAFFTEKPVHRIIGMEERANRNLAIIARDYAHERWAANRDVHPLLWRWIGKFMDEISFLDIVRVAHSNNHQEREAAALACAQTDYPPAQELFNSMPDLKAEIEKGTLTWNTLAEKIR
jgi:hypothetical protein